MDRTAPVVVVGAGIAGLTAALSFAEAGFDVEILERAPALAEVGAGIQLSPNALRVLGRLGLLPALAPLACSADSVVLRSGRTGRPIAEVPVRSADGTGYLCVHRADLQATLLAAVSRSPRIGLTLGAELLALRQADRGVALEFGRAGGGPGDRETMIRRRAEIVIAADGARSAVARELGLPAARPSRHVAWRMTVEQPPEGPGGIEAWLGPRRHAVAYPIRGGRQVNLVLVEPADGDGDGDGDAPTGRSPEAKPALLHRFRRWDGRLRGLIEAAGPASGWPLLQTDRRPKPGFPGGVLLIGDAAHALLPYAAQGAAMAIEDAWVAAAAFGSAADPSEASARFHAQRDARLRRVRSRIAFHRVVYHLPAPASLARDLVLRLRSPRSLARDLAWLYDWQPPSLREDDNGAASTAMDRGEGDPNSAFPTDHPGAG